MKLSLGNLSIDRGDTVILYTDGIIEAKNLRDELYGYDRFEARIRNSSTDPDIMKATIIDDVNRFTGLSSQHDDMTLVCFGVLP